jgi:hypothetical protein
MDITSKDIIKENMSEEDTDKLTREWTEKMADAIIEQTWSIAIRKIANAALFVASMSILITILTSIVVSAKAGCVTAIIAFLTLGLITEVMARITNGKNKDAVLKAAIETTNSSRI